MRKEVSQTLQGLSWILAISFSLSLMAEWYWFFDLFSHFSNQYIFGGMVLSTLLILLKKKKHATLCFLVALFALIETRTILQYPLQFFSPYDTDSQIKDKKITLLQYNHNFNNRNFNLFKEWVTRPRNNPFDVIVLQEASEYTLSLAHDLNEIYPYQIHEQRSMPFGMIILSRYAIKTHELIPFTALPYKNFLLKAVIETPSFPVTVYALHAIPPGGRVPSKQRNIELARSAQRIANDQSENIILIGDLNLTPTSPYFKNFKTASKLEFQSFGLFLNPTWPDNHYFNFLKIPIDHVMHSSNIRVLDKKPENAFGSDHQTLITTLEITK